MTHRKKKRLTRAGSLTLCLCMLLTCFPVAAFAVTEDGLCEHHPEHTEDCGYIQGEQDCGYFCEECAQQTEKPAEEPEEEPEEPAQEPEGESQQSAPQNGAAAVSTGEELTEDTAAVKVVKDGTTTYYASFDDLVAGSMYGNEDITILKDTALNTACNNFGCNSLTVNAGVTLTLNADLYFLVNGNGNTPLSGSGTIAGSGTLTACGDVSGLTISCPLKMNSVARHAFISGGTFSNSVTISGSSSKITGGTFSGIVNVEGEATIEGGTFHGTVNNGNTDTAQNYGTINNGTFTGTVNNENGAIYGGTFSGMVYHNLGKICGGTFSGGVENRAQIYGGIFNCTVKNGKELEAIAMINGGTFNGQIINYDIIGPEEDSVILGNDFSIINYGEVQCGDNHIRNDSNICRLCGDGCTHENWESGICKTCGTVCKHESYENGKCEKCGCDCTHENYENGFCTACGGYQPAVLNNGVYEIGNAGQFCWFAEFVNAGNTEADAVLTADIDLAGIDWTPIGLYTDDATVTANRKNTAYSGTFDGQYHVISNLSVNISETNYEAGLFSRVISGGVLKNFGILNATITQTSNGHENKGVRAGVVAGEIFGGTVTNVFTAGNLTISTQHEQKGGIAGECASSTLTSCHTTYGMLTTKVSVESYNPTLSRCYYMAEEANSNSYGENMTEAQFASGEVAFEMNGRNESGVWKQKLGADKYPKFTGKVVCCVSLGGVYYNPLDESDIQSVSITWGAMSFTYTDGGWNTETLTYDEGSWTASGNTVKVANNGTVTVKAMVSYTNADGYIFAADWSKKTAEITGGTDFTFTMNLSGQPTSALNNATIGNVTVTLTDAGTAIGWVAENSGIIYYENGSRIEEGTRIIDGVEYQFYFNGLILQNSIYKLDGKCYYGDGFGCLEKGWISVTENDTTVWYYAKEDYSLAMNETLEIDGETYTFDANGRSDKVPSDDDMYL